MRSLHDYFDFAVSWVAILPNVSFRRLRPKLCNRQLPLIVYDYVIKIAAPASGY